MNFNGPDLDIIMVADTTVKWVEGLDTVMIDLMDGSDAHLVDMDLQVTVLFIFSGLEKRVKRKNNMKNDML